MLPQISGELISFSTIRHNVYLIQFTKSRYLLQKEESSYLIIRKICPSFVNHWETLQQSYGTCFKQIRWPHTSNKLDIIFHWISAAYFWLQNFNKKLIKEINVLQIFVKEQCFEKKCFDNKKWNEFSSVMNRPMFRNMSKTFCHLGRLGTWNLMDIFRSSCWVTLFYSDCFLQGSGKNNTATSVYDILNLYVKLHISATNFR